MCLCMLIDTVGGCSPRSALVYSSSSLLIDVAYTLSCTIARNPRSETVETKF